MKKKTPRALSLVLALALSLAACGTGAAPQPQGDTVTLTALNAQKEPAEVAVPYDPQRIAVLDMATLDILDALGVGGRGWAPPTPAWTISKLRRRRGVLPGHHQRGRPGGHGRGTHDRL
ncbi:MAG: hypothetical protein V8S11_10090 [Flavonifractor plautii]